jgi:photosystem II stability/assembly factor-like uncharacterized protein
MSTGAQKPSLADPKGLQVAWTLTRWAVGAAALAAAVQAGLCALGPCGLCSAWADAGPAAKASATAATDPLFTPAVRSPRAAQSVLLGITRAGSRLVAVGERGVILTSDDHGRQWQQASVPVSATLTAVHFPTPQRGWAVGHGGVILHSEDGGRQWRKQLDGVAAAQLELDAARVAAAQASGDEATSGAAKRRLRDAQRLLDDGADKPWLDVRFTSATEGIVVGAYGGILRTQDGGRSWQSLRGHMANPKGRHLYSLQQAGDTLYVVGEQGQLFRSRDRAAHFDTLATPYAGTYFGLQASPAGELLAYGLRGNALRSTDDGQTWQKVDTGQPITLTAGTRRPDGSVVLVDESGRVLQQSASGFQPLSVPQGFSFTGVVTAADGSLVLTGVRGSTRIAPEQLLASAQP